MNTISEEELKKRFIYYPENGCFLRICGIKKGTFVTTKNSGGYLHVKIKGKFFGLHRLAWLYIYGCMPDGEIDHINGIKDDNRVVNLRIADRSLNCQNIRQPRSDNTSGFLGVSWHKQHQKWIASLFVNGRNKHLGLFSEPETAHAAYLKAKRELHKGATI